MGGGSENEGVSPTFRGPNAGGAGKGGTGLGEGETGGGKAPFGVPGGGGGVGPKSKFMGQSGNATRIAFLCDRSGSMAGRKTEALQSQLKESVAGLKPIQGVNLIFFAEGPPLALNANKLVPATSDGKRQAYDFINDLVATAGTNPLPAIEMAFKQDAQLIYFLTDGDFGFSMTANDEVLKKFRDLNKDGKVKVNTIAFVSTTRDLSGSATEGYVQLLKKIAEENGGRFAMKAADEF